MIYVICFGTHVRENKRPHNANVLDSMKSMSNDLATLSQDLSILRVIKKGITRCPLLWINGQHEVQNHRRVYSLSDHGHLKGCFSTSTIITFAFCDHNPTVCHMN